MSNSAPQTRSGRSRRQLAIVWGVIAGFVILVLLLLGFCNSPEPTPPPGSSPQVSLTSVSPSGPSVSPSVAGSSDPGVDPNDPGVDPVTSSKPQVSTTARASHTPPPKGGPDTGGGSTAPSGVVLFAVGLVILLAAVGATVQAFRPRRSRR